MTTVCVGRELELKKLQQFFEKSLTEKTQICFVVGEAGSGKTTLVNGFFDIVEKVAPEAIIAYAECDAQVGISDPYLPFREILAVLTGDTETKQARPKTAKNLGKFAETAIEALLEIGPDLIGSIIPGGALIARGVKIFSEKSEVIKQIKRRLNNQIEMELNQSTIFQQYTNVLSALAKKQPIVIILDDLHWVDNASAALLFHLARKLSAPKLLIIGTYRPNEIHPSTDGTRHPMEAVANELKRYHGDIWINLDSQAKNESLEFVNAIIDIEPNQINNEFRQKLFALTEGNALFTSELLRNMKEKGELVLNSDGNWVEGPLLDWQEIPPKVEGVIQERIARLESELKKALSIASVEGENFTAQVISRLEALTERVILSELSDELENQHKLVVENGELKIGKSFLSFFRFSHSLIHQYLYNELGTSERRILHKQVANALESLYQDQVELIYSQLARHYEEAGDTEKAVHYLSLIAAKALRISAFHEAKNNLVKALELGTSEVSILETIHRQLGEVFYGLGDYPSSLAHLEKCLELAQISNDTQLNLAICKLELSKTLIELGELERAEKNVRECIDIAKEFSQEDLLIKSLSELGYIMLMIGDVHQAKKILEESITLEEKLEKNTGHISKVRALYTLGCCEVVLGNLEKAEAAFLEDIRIAKQLGNREWESYSVTNLGYVAYEVGDLEKARDLLEQGLKLGQEIDAQWTIGDALTGLGFLHADLGEYSAARAQLQDALRIYYSTKNKAGLFLALIGSAELMNQQGQDVEALQLLGLILNHARSLGDTYHYVELVLTTLKRKQPEEVIAQQLENGKTLDLDSVVNKFLEL